MPGFRIPDQDVLVGHEITRGGRVIVVMKENRTEQSPTGGEAMHLTL